MAASQLDFTSTTKAYPHKTATELKQTIWMFELLNSSIGNFGKGLLKKAIDWNLPIKPIIKATMYKFFVGGETLEDSMPVVEKLNDFGVKSILDYSEEGVENEAGFEHAFNELKRNIIFSAGKKAIAFSVFKPTAIINPQLIENMSSSKILSAEEEIAWTKGKARFIELCKLSYDNGLQIFIDAEESWLQQAIDDLVHDCMLQFNKERITVINTYQMYLKDRYKVLMADFQKAEAGGYKLGAKLVRGAYMEKERARAKEKGYPSPIQDSKANSDADYNAAVRYSIDRLENMLVVVATHNESSTRLAAEYADEKGYEHNHPNIWFSQLYGMSDHISFNLAAKDYNVVKYLPYGPVKAVTPYLIRRADENSSIEGQARKEIELLRKEIARRRLLKK